MLKAEMRDLTAVPKVDEMAVPKVDEKAEMKAYTSG